MNGKKAKQLRKMVKALGVKLPEVVYTQTNKKNKVWQDPTSKRTFPYETCTVVLGSCLRRLNKKAKKAHYMYNKQ